MAAQGETSLEQTVNRLLEHLDAMDLDGLGAMLDDAVQGIDEIARKWTRGRPAIERYFTQLKETVSEVRSRMSDVQEYTWGDAGLVTFVLDQTYTLNGHHAEHLRSGDDRLSTPRQRMEDRADPRRAAPRGGLSRRRARVTGVLKRSRLVVSPFAIRRPSIGNTRVERTTRNSTKRPKASPVSFDSSEHDSEAPAPPWARRTSRT